MPLFSDEERCFAKVFGLLLRAFQVTVLYCAQSADLHVLPQYGAQAAFISCLVPYSTRKPPKLKYFAIMPWEEGADTNPVSAWYWQPDFSMFPIPHARSHPNSIISPWCRKKGKPTRCSAYRIRTDARVAFLILDARSPEKLIGGLGDASLKTSRFNHFR